ncbi:LysR substrate-binding domain-containing protein [Streptomyces sp. NPDC044780]|uniref:LysR family transcriptional regulator n=1 Tax=unclassified Streptomyces TaxID=2593676 RepID=UPI0033C4AFFC
MDLRQLRYFVAVAEELHFGRAAARLHMSQPPLSQRVRELEEELGCRLLERSSHGVRLTDGGRILLAEAKEILERAERAKEKVRRSAGHRTVVVGAVAGAGLALDDRVRETFRRRRPQAAVRLRECGLTDPSAGLRTGQVDMALTRLPFDTTGIAVRVLYEEPLVAVVPATDPLAGSAQVDVADLRGRMAFRLPPGTDPRWRDFWLATDADEPDTPVVSTIGECLHAVAWRSAVGLLPAAAARRHAAPGVSFVPVTGHRPSRVVVAWRAGEVDRLVLDLIDIVGGGPETGRAPSRAVRRVRYPG